MGARGIQVQVMAGPPPANDRDLNPAFWVLFIVGLVVVLSLFRGFLAAMENAKLRDTEAKRR